MNLQSHTSRKLALATLYVAALCTGGAVAADNETAKADTTAHASTSPGEGNAAAVPLGDLAGGRRDTLAPGIANPHASDAQAIERGKKLFSAMNCAGCHGYDAKGGMGPDLTDTYWLYGGTPVMIYKSIYEGRPQGMPAWQAMLPTDPIWDIVAYIQSLGGTFPADKYEAGLKGDLGKGDTRHAEKGASPNTRGRR
jgi:cytochrome c oxidase cbb3-type subunit III